MRWIGIMILIMATAVPAQATVIGRTLEYKDGDTTLEGYLAYDDAFLGADAKRIAQRPGILVVHEWKGLGEHAKHSAEKLAQEGYVALAVDMYGEGIRPQTNEEAGKEAGKYKNDRPLMRQRIKAGLDVLAAQPNVDRSKLAANGYCFGGTTVLELARSGADIKGVVSFHGGLNTPNPADAKDIKARVLVLHGADDPFVKPEEVAAFEEEMKGGKVDYRIVRYPGAVHSFTNPQAGDDPSKGMAYNAKANQESWEEMKKFFAEIFK